jgi:acetoin utilization deacetylase AcuC-like enzyme
MQAMRHFDYRSYGDGAMIGPVVPVTGEDLMLAHSAGYIHDIFSGAINNGFENTNPWVPTSCLWTIGSLLSAARWAIDHPLTPVCSPTSGFHHAGYDFGGGYCTFNGLMVVAAKLILENPKFKVGILDLDMHAGDGTVSILNKHKDLAKNVRHHSNGEHWYGQEDPDEWFIWLQECIDSINAFKPDLVLYQAGADMHIRDPLGGLLDDGQMAQRDRSVFRKIQAPVVWNLAGGYQPATDLLTDPVIQIHRTTLRESNLSTESRAANQLKAKQ